MQYRESKLIDAIKTVFPDVKTHYDSFYYKGIAKFEDTVWEDKDQLLDAVEDVLKSQSIRMSYNERDALKKEIKYITF